MFSFETSALPCRGKRPGEGSRKRQVLSAGMIAIGAWLALPAAGYAQTGTRILDTGRVDAEPSNTQLAVPGTQLPQIQNKSVVPQNADKRFILKRIKIDGAGVLGGNDFLPLYQRTLDHEITVREIYAIADGIAAAYKSAGYALFSVFVPDQSFADGNVVIKVVEGHVRRVVVGGDTDGADLALLSAYGEKIANEIPLRQATLERYTLLMGDIHGLTVGSRFAPVADEPGAVDLVLTLKRKTIDASLGINNYGSPLLGQTQAIGIVGANSLLREGDNTLLTYGTPVDFDKFQYVSLSHATPIGTEGTMVQASGGYLQTTPKSPNPAGRAYVMGAQISHPVLRGVDTNLTLIGALDVLESESAVLGNTTSAEKTRVLRGGASLSVNDNFLSGDDKKATTATNLVVSHGLDVFKAKMQGQSGATSDFTKVNLRVGRDQPLAGDFIARLRTFGQYTNDTLTASEQFTYGGAEFGRAFNNAALQGDQGIAGSMEIAFAPPNMSEMLGFLKFAEVYTFVDGSKIWNVRPNGNAGSDTASSGGVGIRLTALDKAIIGLETGTPLTTPTYTMADRSWNFRFSVKAAY